MDEYRSVEKMKSLPTIVCGDFNAGPGSLVYKTISVEFNDVQLSGATQKGQPTPTFISWFPFRRIDHIFISDQLEAIRVDVPENIETKSVSDHLPIVAEVVLASQETPTLSPAPPDDY